MLSVARKGTDAKGVCAPFPRVADHIEEPYAVRSKRIGRCCTCVSVCAGIQNGKLPLPDVARQYTRIVRLRIAPWKSDGAAPGQMYV